MKKTILLFFAIAGIISCTDKDTIPKNQVDPIVGEWKLQSIVYNQTGTNLASECQMKSTYKFNEDGSITGTVYTEDIGGNCFEKQVNSTWEHIDNSNNDYLIDNSIKIVKFSDKKTTIVMKSKNIVDECIFKLFGNENTYKKK
ncbi:MAG: lipocalin family protein [Polaribacter sp.]|jgi:hypothetical protein|nr:lipocalin family protein [Polaribacter sp.]MBT6081409.1 lipocalin family protein [Polaribacter sp.]MBT7135175.1 lipocalin family protein [Polaribacter sp.]